MPQVQLQAFWSTNSGRVCGATGVGSRSRRFSHMLELENHSHPQSAASVKSGLHWGPVSRESDPRQDISHFTNVLQQLLLKIPCFSACPGRATTPIKQSPWFFIGLHLAVCLRYTGTACVHQPGSVTPSCLWVPLDQCLPFSSPLSHSQAHSWHSALAELSWTKLACWNCPIFLRLRSKI